MSGRRLRGPRRSSICTPSTSSSSRLRSGPLSSPRAKRTSPATGQGRRALDAASRARKTGPCLEMWRKLDAAASTCTAPSSALTRCPARVSSGVAASQADMAQIMAKMDQESAAPVSGTAVPTPP